MILHFSFELCQLFKKIRITCLKHFFREIALCFYWLQFRIVILYNAFCSSNRRTDIKIILFLLLGILSNIDFPYTESCVQSRGGRFLHRFRLVFL